MGFKERLLIFVLIIILLGFFSYYWPILTGRLTDVKTIEYPKEKVIVDRIIDGDTIVVSGEIGDNIHIRLLGFNTL
jgi:endonuclease YncB( thermonuclease family)